MRLILTKKQYRMEILKNILKVMMGYRIDSSIPMKRPDPPLRPKPLNK